MTGGKNKELAGDARRRLLAIIQQRPGIHKSELARQSGLAWSTVTYHVTRLERLQEICVTKVGGIAHLTPHDFTPPGGTVGALFAPHAREIVQFLNARGVQSPGHIRHALGLGEKVVRRHLDALTKDGIVASDGAYHPRYWVAPSQRPLVQTILNHGAPDRA